jgi:hypothetical protein
MAGKQSYRKKFEKSIPRQRLGRHVPEATNTHKKINEPLVAVFPFPSDGAKRDNPNCWKPLPINDYLRTKQTERL